MSSKPWHAMTALELGAGIADKSIDAVALTEHFLQRIGELDPEHRVYLRPTPERARAEARAAAARVEAGLRLGPLDGVPMSWKDLTDAAGIPTTFGSALFRDRVPTRDALLLQRASRAGMVCLGKTNLSEFAYSGLGINPTYGTPANAADAEVARVPGGSSSGAGVSVGAGLAPAAIGSDTGGSVRIPAALNGVVGLKTSIGLLPLDGIMALSPSLDTIGPLTRDVADAAAIFAVLNDSRPFDLHGASLRGQRLLKPADVVFTGLDEMVAAATAAALDRLADAGAEIVEAPVPEFQQAFDVVAEHGNIISAEGYALWRDELDARHDEMYWGIYERFALARRLTGIDAERAHILLRKLARRFHARIAGYAGVVLPTCPRVAPPIAALENDPEAYDEANMALTRNTRLGNLLVTCGVSLPCQREGELPVGLQLMTLPRREGALLRLAAAAEQALA